MKAITIAALIAACGCASAAPAYMRCELENGGGHDLIVDIEAKTLEFVLPGMAGKPMPAEVNDTEIRLEVKAGDHHVMRAIINRFTLRYLFSSELFGSTVSAGQCTQVQRSL